MIEYVLDNLAPIGGIDRIYVVTNAKFAGHFQKWSDALPRHQVQTRFHHRQRRLDRRHQQARRHRRHPFRPQNAKRGRRPHRRGRRQSVQREAGRTSANSAARKTRPCWRVYDVGDLEEIKKYNSITLDADGRITFFEEKPKNPTSTLTGIALYYYPKSHAAAHQAIHRRGQQPRPARPARAMALPAHAGLYLARAGPLVRHRLEGNPGRSQPDFREVFLSGEIKPFVAADVRGLILFPPQEFIFCSSRGNEAHIGFRF